MVIHHWLKQKKLEELSHKEKNRDFLNRQMDIETQSRSTPYKIVDMTKAYQQVVNSGHIPSDKEINFRQFTSSELNVKK